VIGHCAAKCLRADPLILVAAVTVGVCHREVVVVVDVAVRTGRGGVYAGQRPTGGAVIKGGGGPGDGVVTGGAVGSSKRRASRCVRRVIGLLPGGEVTAGVAAIIRLNGEGVVSIDVARGATGNFSSIGDKLMRIGQRETGGGVIEFAVGPNGDGVAGRAGGGCCREIGGDVIGNIAAESLCFVPVGCVAGHAVRGVEGVVVADVAGSTGRRSGRHVRSDEGKTGNAVVERSGIPTECGMALGAVGRGESCARRGVHGSGGLLPASEVATGISAVGRLNREVVIAIDVAGCAGHVGVAIGQRETNGGVVELAIGPLGDGVATRTGSSGGGESSSDVVGHTCAKRLCFVPVGRVAGHAIGGVKGVVVTDMAGSAGRRIGRHVRSDEGKTGNAVIERRRIPAFGGMAVGAIGGGKSWSRSGVNGIGGLLPSGEVAPGISTIGRSDGQGVVVVDVAGGAGDVGVAIGQQETGGAVIK
jgi:hypothetical protein